jgi:hypothetical protein
VKARIIAGEIRVPTGLRADAPAPG